LNLAPTDEGVVGIGSVIDAYRGILPNVKLWGPTIFSQVMQILVCDCVDLKNTQLLCVLQVVQWAASSAAEGFSQESQHFTILLIITDGVITDLESTKLEIIRASREIQFQTSLGLTLFFYKKNRKNWLL
jgi:hypothetical protein